MFTNHRKNKWIVRMHKKQSGEEKERRKTRNSEAREGGS